MRFAVNAIAPYLLTQRLLPLLGSSGRVVNLSSAAQSPVDPRALAGDVRLSDGAAYAQSKAPTSCVAHDVGRFTSPHPDALDPRRVEEIVRVIEAILAKTR